MALASLLVPVGSLRVLEVQFREDVPHVTVDPAAVT